MHLLGRRWWTGACFLTIGVKSHATVRKLPQRQRFLKWLNVCYNPCQCFSTRFSQCLISGSLKLCDSWEFPRWFSHSQLSWRSASWLSSQREILTCTQRRQLYPPTSGTDSLHATASHGHHLLSLREQRALPSYLAAFCTCYRLHCVTHITSTTITLLKFWAICIAVTLIAIQSLGIKNNRHASLNDKTRRRKVLWSIFNPRLGNRFVQCGMRGQPYFISILSLTNFWNSNSTKKLWILCHSGRDGSTTCQSINRRPAVQWQLLTFCVQPIAQPKAW